MSRPVVREFQDRMLSGRRVEATLLALGFTAEQIAGFRQAYQDVPKQTKTSEIKALLSNPQALRELAAKLEAGQTA